MKFGAHLPLIDFDGMGWQPGALDSFTDAARDLGYDALSANDHLLFQKPWLDGIVALSSVVSRSGSMTLATTISLPVVRHPLLLAKHAAALDLLSGGRLVLGVGPGSSARDYAALGIDFEQRWPRFDEALRVLRTALRNEAHPATALYGDIPKLEPAPARGDGPPIWVGSWGSAAGLRRVARYGDGWLASAYNTTPGELSQARIALAAELTKHGKDPSSFPIALATMWTYITASATERDNRLSQIAAMLNRNPETLKTQIFIGSAEHCAATLRAYAAAGVDTVFIWPIAEPAEQLRRFIEDVAPHA